MLLNSGILEVIIGLTFIYLLFSLITSALNEWIAGILKLRSKTLREGIENLLNDPNGRRLAKSFYDHPLILGLGRGRDGNPSYIPARTFARVLMDLVAPADLQSGPRDWIKTYEKVIEDLTDVDPHDELRQKLRILISEAGIDIEMLKGSAQGIRELQEKRERLVKLVSQAEDEFEGIEPVTQALEKVREVETVLQQTEKEAMAAIHQAQLNVENYFNEAMDRVSGWYKRQAQMIMIGIAAVLVLLFNVDSIDMANSLLTDPAMRASITAQAEGFTSAAPVDDTANELARISTLKTEIEQTGLPIGWQALPDTIGGWLYKIVGLLMTIIAVSQGAPFWFDIVNRLVNIRMAGKKPEEEPAVAK